MQRELLVQGGNLRMVLARVRLAVRVQAVLEQRGGLLHLLLAVQGRDERSQSLLRVLVQLPEGAGGLSKLPAELGCLLSPLPLLTIQLQLAQGLQTSRKQERARAEELLSQGSSLAGKLLA